MRYMKKSLMPVFIAMFLVSCSTLMPKSFDQELAVGYTTQTSVLQTVTSLLERNLIEKNTASQVMKISDQAGVALDTARAMKHLGNMEDAEQQLKFAVSILDQLAAYLAEREKPK